MDSNTSRMIQMNEHDRDALMVAYRLAAYIRDNWNAVAVKGIRDCYRKGSDYVDPRAVPISLERMGEDWDDAVGPHETAEVKPGTRCECRTHDHGNIAGEPLVQCMADAVRLVVVPPESIRPWTGHAASLPMCAACAEYHERDKKERETASAIHAIHGMPGEPEPDYGYDYGLCECGQPANPSGHCDDCDDLEPEDEGMPGEPELCPECGTNSEPCRCKTIRRFPGPVPK